VAAFAQDTTTIKQINAPPPSGASTTSTITVQGFRAPDVGTWGVARGFVSLPTGNGTTHNGHEFLTSNNQPSQNNSKNPCDQVAEPILPKTGSKVETYPIFALPGEMGLKLVLYYNTSRLGSQWSTNFDYWLDTQCDDEPNLTGPCKFYSVYRPDGSKFKFGKAAVDSGNPPPNPQNITTLALDAATGHYIFHDEDATTQVYDANGNLIAITDASGVGWTLNMSGINGTVTGPNGQSIQMSSVASSSSPVTVTWTVTDPAGNNYQVVYGGNGGSVNDVSSITLPGSPSTVISFKYTSLPISPFPTVLSEVDYNGTPHDYTSYVTTAGPYYGWASGTHLADGSENTAISYSTDANGSLVATIVNPLGHQSIQTYAGSNGTGGGANGELSTISDDAVQTCGATVHGRSYDSNGHLSEEIDNNGNEHTYTYAANGQLQSETEAYGTAIARTTDYTWDPNVLLNRKLSETIEGVRKTTYTYDAHNRLASVSVTNLTGNGIANQTLTTTYSYTLYGNGLVQTETVSHPSPNNSDTDTYSYDTLGNLTSFSNGLGQTTTYSNYNALGEARHVVGPNGDATDYTYDPRGRLATKTTYPNGSSATWTYAYDGFGELYSVTGPDGQVTTWNRDAATMRVMSITHNDKDGTATESFGYDPNGDVTSHTVARGGNTTLVETSKYDSLGRIYQKLGQHGQSLTYAYDGNGNVLSTTDAVGHTVVYQYDALDRVKSKTESGGASPPIPSTAPTINGPGNSDNGSYTVSWNSIPSATAYVFQEQVNGESWSTIQNNANLSWSASGKSSGTYSYRVMACNTTGCSPWSSTAIVYVTQILGNIDGVPIDGSGNASIGGWACSTGLAQSINVDLYVGGPYGSGTFVGRYTANQSSEPAVANACNVGSGSYRFSIPLSTTARGQYAGQTIYIHGISPIGAANLLIGNSGSYTVPVNEPAGAPVLNAPSTNNTGSYTVSWSAITGATSYVLQEQINSGSWSTIQTASATNRAISGKGNGTYGYHVQACNSSGCSPWSVVASVAVLLPPPATASLAVPATSSGNVVVSWPVSSTATSYTLQHRLGAGGWTTVYSGSGTSTTVAESTTGTYTYQVQACNAGGCSAWTASSAVAVTIPPASAPGLSAPSTNSTGNYTVSWTGVNGATSYTLQEQTNGGGWNTVQAGSNMSWGASGRSTATYGYQVQACNAGGCGPWSGISNTVVTIPVPIAINGNSYNEYASISGAGGVATIGFLISGNTWQVYGSAPSGNTVKASGSVPATAVTVQYTWTNLGVPAGDTDSGGTVTNGAPSPTALSGNPSSHYTTNSYTKTSPTHGRSYQLRVDFYNAAGANVSSSTCTLTAETQGING
jgi:YD repeat-containing protein